MLFGFGNKKLLGLDIGSSTIKIAELEVGRSSASLINFGIVQTPPHSTANGDIIDPQALSETIRELALEIKTKRKHAAVSLWGASAIIKRITIPKMEKSLIAEQIRWEAEQYIPYDVNDVNLGFEILKQSGYSSETMDILLIAAMQSGVYKCAEVVQMADLDCSIVDVNGFALFNCFERNYKNFKNENVALFNVGATNTTFVVVEGGEVVFCRDIPVGGVSYTNEIQKTMNMGFDEAENMKISISSGEPAPEQVSHVIQSINDIVRDEISGSVEFYLNTNNAERISKAYITGGGSKILGVREMISSVIPGERFDPFKAIKVKARGLTPAVIDEVKDFASISVGLGMRRAGDS